MKFEPEITIKGNLFKYIHTQQHSGVAAIYRSDSSYLRIGDRNQISKILTAHKNMESYNFPVAKILDEGSVESMSYFIEESLGPEHFGSIFKKETDKFG